MSDEQMMLIIASIYISRHVDKVPANIIGVLFCVYVVARRLSQ